MTTGSQLQQVQLVNGQGFNTGNVAESSAETLKRAENRLLAMSFKPLANACDIRFECRIFLALSLKYGI